MNQRLVPLPVVLFLLHLTIPLVLSFAPCSICHRNYNAAPTTARRRHENAVAVAATPYTDNNDEETLLLMFLDILPNVNPNTALERVQKYAQSFPFSAVLPVQPLQYLPTEEGGVNVLFLRKKTQEKGSIDGGMQFFITLFDQETVEIHVKRNSEGQTISKSFTERMVVRAFCDGIAGQSDEKTGRAPTDVVSVAMAEHKWK